MSDTKTTLNMPAADYHAHPAVSKSQLDEMQKSPLHFYSRHVAKTTPREPTAAMTLGTALHYAVLEPDLFRDTYREAPDCDRRTKAGKEEWAAFMRAEDNRASLSPADMNSVFQMSRSVETHPASKKLLALSPLREVSYFWTDADTDVDCRCRPDAVLAGNRALIDIKSSVDASPQAFAKSIAKYGYHRQADWYLRGVEAATGIRPESFIFVVVESAPPYAVGVYVIDDESIAEGRYQNMVALDRVAQCRASGKWPSYSESIEPISAPTWALTRNK